MSQFRAFAEQVVAENDDFLLDYSPGEQVDRAVAALEKLNARRPLRPLVREVNAFGFGTALTCFVTGDAEPDETYLRLTPMARAIGIEPAKTAKIAEDRIGWAIRDQRENDEKSGVLGWECLNDWIDLNLSLVLDDPDAKPDAGGHRWSYGSEWLMTLDRLMDLVGSSPWSREFMNNAMPMFSHAFSKSGLEAAAGECKTVVKQVDGEGSTFWTPGPTVADAFAATREGISEDEARRRAYQGPSIGGAA